MKRKIIFTLVIACALICLLSLSALAASTDEFGTPELVKGMSEKSAFGADGTANGFTSRVVLFDGEEYHTYPSYYIFENKTETSLSFAELNEKATKSYSNKSVIRVEVPKNMLKLWDVFRDNSSLKYVYLPETVTVIGGNAFWACHGLEYANVPRDCVSIESYAFIGCSKLVTLDMTEARSLKRTGDSNTFENCSSLKALIFPEGFEHFGGASGVTSLEELYLPNSTTYMGGISKANSLKKVTIPLGVTSLRSYQFDWSPGIKCVVIHKGVTSIPSNALSLTYYISEVIYTGSETDAVVNDIKAAFSGSTITYANHCDVYYDGAHFEDGNPCVINCQQCGAVNEPEKNPIHEKTTKMEYASFALAGSRNVVCTNEGCAYKEATEAPALFECLGYSLQQVENGGFVLGYKINSSAIEEYESISGSSIMYGVFASGISVGNSDAVDANGNVISGALGMNLTKFSNAVMQIKITGFATTEQKNAKIAIGAFVIDTGKDSANISYLQTEEPQNGEKYAFVTYNQICGVTE